MRPMPKCANVWTLRQKASLTNFVLAAIGGQQLSGAEIELRQAVGIGDGIPLEIFDTETRASRQDSEVRVDVVSGVPGSGLAVNPDPLRPMVFANSVIPGALGVAMPNVMSGTYSTSTITTAPVSGAYAPGGEVMATASTFAVGTATPKRVSARLAIQIEQIAEVGIGNFESMLRESMALSLSAELDNQGLNGSGVAPNLAGLFMRLGAATPAPVGVADWNSFAAANAGMVEGTWATDLMDTMILAGPATYQLAARTFQSTSTYAGEMSAASYARMNTAGLMTNGRMPDAVSDIQQGIGRRMGRNMAGGEMGMRVAVCPVWDQNISIDDIYSGSAKGERYYTAHVLLGDVILVQPSAYVAVSYQLA